MTGLPRLGFGLPVSGSWATPEAMREVAERAEALGYSSLWTFQRLMHPVDQSWGAMYRSVHDPLISLAHVAALTSRVRLGVAVLNAPFHPPLLLSKQLTTLDAVSGGRLDVGLGLGWAPEEFRGVGVPFERRGARMDEHVRCLKAVWGPDPVRFDGDFYEVPEAEVQPKPVQQPHPPLLLGGTAQPALRRAGRLGDGWVSASRHDLRRVGEAIDVVRGAAAEAGRDPAGLQFVIRAAVGLGHELSGRDGRRRPMTGDADVIREDIADLGRQGATDVLLDLNFTKRVGTPDADPVASIEHAHEVLETFAPG